MQVDLNGHVWVGVEGFEGVHGGFVFGKRNLEGEMILEFADALNFVVANNKVYPHPSRRMRID